MSLLGFTLQCVREFAHTSIHPPEATYNAQRFIFKGLFQLFDYNPDCSSLRQFITTWSLDSRVRPPAFTLKLLPCHYNLSPTGSAL